MMSRLFFFFVGILLLAASALAQGSVEKEIDLAFLRMTIPTYFIDQKMKAVEGGGYRYKGDGLTLVVDYNDDCYRPTFERTDPAYDYTEETLSINGVPAKLWSMRKGAFMAGANYGTRQGRPRLAIWLSGDDKQGEKIKEIARKIFLSVKFRPKKSS